MDRTDDNVLHANFTEEDLKAMAPLQAVPVLRFQGRPTLADLDRRISALQTEVSALLGVAKDTVQWQRNILAYIQALAENLRAEVNAALGIRGAER